MTALYDIPLKTIDDQPTTLAPYRGKVLLVVNVASKCGLTPQYQGLEALYRARRDAGLEILGFPANNFMEQEPGSNAEIASFCSANFDVTFPLFSKISVAGNAVHPLYQALVDAQPVAIGEGPLRQKLKSMDIKVNPAPGVSWNFEKFLIGRDGRVLARFAPDVAPDDPRLLQALDAALAAG